MADAKSYVIVLQLNVDHNGMRIIFREETALGKANLKRAQDG